MENLNYDEIDSSKFLCEEMKKRKLNKYKNFLVKINHIVSTLLNSGLICEFDTLLSFFYSFSVVFVFSTLSNIDDVIETLAKDSYINRAYKKKLLETDEFFLNLKSEYKKLLEKTKEYIMSIDIKDEIIMDIFLTNMIKNGFLSNSDEFELKIIEKQRVIIDIGEIRGARIMSGHGVCRHISDLIIDLNRLLNIESNALYTYVPNDKNTIEYLKNKDFSVERIYGFTNHEIINLKTKKGSILFDPTSNYILEIVDDYKNYLAKALYKIDLNGTINIKNFDILEFLFESLDFFDNILLENDMSMLLDKVGLLNDEGKIEKRNITNKELAILNNEANIILKKEIKNLQDFKKENLKLIKSISKKEKIISGY